MVHIPTGEKRIVSDDTQNGLAQMMGSNGRTTLVVIIMIIIQIDVLDWITPLDILVQRFVFYLTW